MFHIKIVKLSEVHVFCYVAYCVFSKIHRNFIRLMKLILMVITNNAIKLNSP